MEPTASAGVGLVLAFGEVRVHATAKNVTSTMTLAI